MLKRVLLFTILLSASALWAQDKPVYTLTGKVVDESGQPMPGASVVDRGTMLGAVADAEGNFSLRFSEFPVFLEVSFIGYSIHYSELNPDDFSPERELTITIQMQPRSQQLQPVTVEGKRYEEFFVHRDIAVIDFVFVGENTLLLLREGMWDYKLALINEAEDSLAHLDIEVPATGFVEDCLGHIYMQGRDEVYGLSFAGNNIHMIGTIDNEWYDAKVKPCVASNPQNLYYQFLQYGNQMMDVFQSPMAGGETMLIRRIVDLDDAFSINEYGNDAAAILSGVNRMGPIGIRELGNFKRGYAKMAWYENILTIPVYHPLFTTTKGALLFDHLHDTVLVLDNEGFIQEKYPVEHHHNKDFAEEILQDVVTGILYVRYEKAGMVTLTELSPDNFKPVNSYRISEQYDFPRSLKIRNGVAYFLDHAGNDYQKLKLYRQKL